MCSGPETMSRLPVLHRTSTSSGNCNAHSAISGKSIDTSDHPPQFCTVSTLIFRGRTQRTSTQYISFIPTHISISLRDIPPTSTQRDKTVLDQGRDLRARIRFQRLRTPTISHSVHFTAAQIRCTASSNMLLPQPLFLPG